MENERGRGLLKKNLQHERKECGGGIHLDGTWTCCASADPVSRWRSRISYKVEQVVCSCLERLERPVRGVVPGYEETRDERLTNVAVVLVNEGLRRTANGNLKKDPEAPW